MHVQDVATTLPEAAARPPRQPAQPEKTQKAVKGVGLSKPKKVDELNKPGAAKSAGLSKPGKSGAKVGSSTTAEVAKKKSARPPNAIAETSHLHRT
jgi:hypothetical protein